MQDEVPSWLMLSAGEAPSTDRRTRATELNPRNDKMNTCQSIISLEEWDLDLCTGTLIHRSTGCLRNCRPWPQTAARTLPQAYLASRQDEDGISLFEFTHMQTEWLDTAKSLQHVRALFNPYRWRMNRLLHALGWWFPVDQGRKPHHVLRWPLVPNEASATRCCRITAEDAAVALRMAMTALSVPNYSAAFDLTRRALQSCPNSYQAHLIAGICCFRAKIETDMPFTMSTALYLGGLERRLQKAVQVLSFLWERETDKDEWEAANEAVNRYRLLLQEYEEVFRASDEYMRRSIT